MLAEFLSASGWVALVLLAGTTTLPYLLRPSRLSRTLGSWAPSESSWLLRLQPHYYLGYAIAAFAAFHTAAAMSTPAQALARQNQLGLVIATLSLGLVFFQIALGMQLFNRSNTQRRQQRRLHFWVMSTILVTALAHVVLNSPWTAIFSP